MKRSLFFIFLLFAVPCMAQVNINLAWDASASPSPIENPINYTLNRCSDQGLTNCSKAEAGTGLSYGPVTMQHNTTSYFYITAWQYALEVDGKISGTINESAKSNVLRVRAFAPPGNPSNNRIIVTQIGESGEGSPVLSARN